MGIELFNTNDLKDFIIKKIFNGWILIEGQKGKEFIEENFYMDGNNEDYILITIPTSFIPRCVAIAKKNQKLKDFLLKNHNVSKNQFEKIISLRILKCFETEKNFKMTVEAIGFFYPEDHYSFEDFVCYYVNEEIDGYLKM